MKHSLIQYLALKGLNLGFTIIMVSSSLSIRTCTIQINREFYGGKKKFSNEFQNLTFEENYESCAEKKKKEHCQVVTCWADENNIHCNG